MGAATAPVLRLHKEEEEERRGVDGSSSSSNGYKLVPWLSWHDWEFVRDSLFSSSPLIALNRISTWRSRGCVPDLVDVTSSIVEIQLMDPHFNFTGDHTNHVIYSDQMLAMLYCMSILRLVNCVVEKTRKRSKFSIAQAADAIGIPRSLIDVRHEGSHRNLPALPVVRDSSVKALHWLKCYYWDPQKRLIPYQGNGSANIRKEIKSKFHELSYCLKAKQNPQPGSLLVKGKRGIHRKGLCGHTKFLPLMTGKFHSSKLRGSKKQITNTLKTLIQLYASFSSEVVSVLLELLLKALNSSDLVELPKNSQVAQNTHSLLDDWKLVITKFSNKEPELFLTLLKAIVDMIDAEEAMKYDLGRQHLTTSEHRVETGQIDNLSSLFAWLVGQIKGPKPFGCKDPAAEIKVSAAGIDISNAVLMELLRQCLRVSAFGNNQLVNSALHLAQLMGDSSLMDKLSKLFSVSLSNSDASEDIYSSVSSMSLLTQHEESICEAAKKLEAVKHRRQRSKVVKTRDDVGNSTRWVVAKCWSPCPIGMLPGDLGSSGRLPILEFVNDGNKVKISDNRGASPDTQLLDNSNVEKTNGKREASSDIQLLNNAISKKMRETVEGSESDGEDVLLPEGVKGRLMIGGVWKIVGEEELLAIESAVRILV
ncbi:Las1 domain-containing protein [Cephalotus follicularis]|uniref:Las1 domain-containing protein n=1 Tax=Cephalotus follicularis TaxID=3775 RepID=A0A1Q3B2L5_CEPFO|nr:Las1 domain-containing protein [Cephalotus follicularis]